MIVGGVWRRVCFVTFEKVWLLLAFSWQLLLDRIPTKQNLALRNVFSSDASISCVFCNNHVPETTIHVFLHCKVVISAWDKIMRWLVFNFIPPHDLFAHLECGSDAASTKKLRKCFWLIWHATIWVIWKAMND